MAVEKDPGRRNRQREMIKEELRLHVASQHYSSHAAAEKIWSWVEDPDSLPQVPWTDADRISVLTRAIEEALRSCSTMTTAQRHAFERALEDAGRG
jgi:hypothetical protein